MFKTPRLKTGLVWRLGTANTRQAPTRDPTDPFPVETRLVSDGRTCFCFVDVELGG